MNKKIVAICLLLMLLLCNVAMANQKEMPVVYDLYAYTALDDEVFYAPELRYKMQNVYAPITMIYEQADGSVVIEKKPMKIGEIMYKFAVCRNLIYGGYAGGWFDTTHLYAQPEDEELLNVAMQEGAVPVRLEYHCNGYDDSIAVLFGGGWFEATYNGTIRYNENGDIIEKIPETKKYAYYFEYGEVES